VPKTIRLHGEHARAIAHGHPWVYRQAVAERPKGIAEGDVVDVSAGDRGFLARAVWEGDAAVAARVWTRDPAEKMDADLVARRIAEAVALRRAAGVPERTEAWRAVNAEGDRMPGVVVERWGEWTSVTLQDHAMQTRRWGEAVLAGVAAALPSRGVYVRDDESSQLAAGEPAPDELWVREPSGTFAVQLAKPGKPGLFTDMREIRAQFAPLLRGRSFLNLFAHTGAFSGAAAAAGAAEVVSVDLSRNFLDAAQRNVARNAPGFRAHETIAADVFETLRGMAGSGRRFGAVLVDPPTFSTSRKSGAFSVKDAYRPLIRAALRVLEPGGLLLAATNFRGVDREDFLRLLHDAAEVESADLRILAALGQPADYPSLALVPETRHLQAALCAFGVIRN
jgi:23S rRNA (cytosine1962-C5)-methyltransferase